VKKNERNGFDVKEMRREKRLDIGEGVIVLMNSLKRKFGWSFQCEGQDEMVKLEWVLKKRKLSLTHCIRLCHTSKIRFCPYRWRLTTEENLGS